jgi:AcrR family transcriptional regulator
MRGSSGHSRTAGAPSRFAAIGKLGCPVTSAAGRGAGREAAICQSVIELLNEASYESVTMDAVASRAKASKATIYRRWANKDDLVIDALQRIFADRSQTLPDTGSLRDDLVASLDQQLRDPALLAATTAALKGLVFAASSDSQLAKALRSTLRASRFESLEALLNRAHARGELPGPVDANLVWEVAQGQFCTRAGVDCGTVDASYVEHLVDDVLMPVISHAGARAAPSVNR